MISRQEVAAQNPKNRKEDRHQEGGATPEAARRVDTGMLRAEESQRRTGTEKADMAPGQCGGEPSG